MSCTTIIAGEVLARALPHIENNIHPIVIISAFKKALEDALQIVEEISTPVDVNSDEEMLKLIKSSIGTKFVSTWSDLMCKLALDAVRTVAKDEERTGRKEVDLKRYARVEKVTWETACDGAEAYFCLSPTIDPRR
jgi:T-complex protein 1 subunit gamma